MDIYATIMLLYSCLYHELSFPHTYKTISLQFKLIYLFSSSISELSIFVSLVTIYCERFNPTNIFLIRRRVASRSSSPLCLFSGVDMGGSFITFSL